MDEINRPESARPAGGGRGRDLRRTVVAAGAALGMTFAGLGIATAQTGQDGPPTSMKAPTEHRDPGRPGIKPGLAAAATAIGVTEDELRTALRDGQSIAQVAQSKGVDVQKVIDAIVADARTRLDAKVRDGDLTQARADEKLENLEQRVTDSVNRTGGLRHGRGPRPADGGGSS